uniref:Uncharacterized protein n=1 Tax=viral metagenome TaxID=1070528 RepID=A0A6M3ISJ8_9ZZZZ
MKLYNPLKDDIKTVIDGNEVLLPAGATVEVCDGFVDRIRKVYPFLEVVASKKTAKAVKSIGKSGKTKLKKK